MWWQFFIDSQTVLREFSKAFSGALEDFFGLGLGKQQKFRSLVLFLVVWVAVILLLLWLIFSGRWPLVYQSLTNQGIIWLPKGSRVVRVRKSRYSEIVTLKKRSESDLGSFLLSELFFSLAVSRKAQRILETLISRYQESRYRQDPEMFLFSVLPQMVTDAHLHRSRHVRSKQYQHQKRQLEQQMTLLLSQFESEEGEPALTYCRKVLPPLDPSYLTRHQEQEKQEREQVKARWEAVHEAVPVRSVSIKIIDKPKVHAFPSVPNLSPLHCTFNQQQWTFIPMRRFGCVIWIAVHPHMPHFHVWSALLTRANLHKRIKRVGGQKSSFLELSHPGHDIRPCGELLSHAQFFDASSPFASPFASLENKMSTHDFVILLLHQRRHKSLHRKFNSILVNKKIA